jgi:hypothetical protein
MTKTYPIITDDKRMLEVSLKAPREYIEYTMIDAETVRDMSDLAEVEINTFTAMGEYIAYRLDGRRVCQSLYYIDCKLRDDKEFMKSVERKYACWIMTYGERMDLENWGDMKVDKHSRIVVTG